MAPAEDSVERNVRVWTGDDEYLVESGRKSWASDEPSWGIWQIAESELNVVPDVSGMDVVELGCGTAYWSAWFARRGARPVGVDPTPAQLERARRFQGEFGLEFPLVQAAGEDVPLPDASFDLAFSEYGASIWADPYRWIPETARLLRPGGALIFLCNSTLVLLCSPDDEDAPASETLQRPQRGMHRYDQWEGVEFHLAHSDWIRVLRDSGFELERLLELYAPEGAKTHPHYDFVTAEWARRWPAEEIWVARKRA
jgi:SAM-dependent methyltransferase